jgi:hypothetical protein
MIRIAHEVQIQGAVGAVHERGQQDQEKRPALGVGDGGDEALNCQGSAAQVAGPESSSRLIASAPRERHSCAKPGHVGATGELEHRKSGGEAQHETGHAHAAQGVTSATPSTSPAIIQAVRRNPTVMPRVIARVMHMPGVAEISSMVGRNSSSLVRSIIGSRLRAACRRQLAAFGCDEKKTASLPCPETKRLCA